MCYISLSRKTFKCKWYNKYVNNTRRHQFQRAWRSGFFCQCALPKWFRRCSLELRECLWACCSRGEEAQGWSEDEKRQNRTETTPSPVSKWCLFALMPLLFFFFSSPAAHVAEAEAALEVIYDDVPSEDPLSPHEGRWLRKTDGCHSGILACSSWLCVIISLLCVSRYDIWRRSEGERSSGCRQRVELERVWKLWWAIRQWDQTTNTEQGSAGMLWLDVCVRPRWIIRSV